MTNKLGPMCPFLTGEPEATIGAVCLHSACAWYDTITNSCAPVALLSHTDKLVRALWDLRSENELRYEIAKGKLDHPPRHIIRPGATRDPSSPGEPQGAGPE